MKICTKCNTKKEHKLFSKHQNRKDGLNSSCKACHSEYRKEHYRKNKRKALEKNRLRRDYLNSKLLEYLLDKCCKDCKNKNPIVLGFDHLRDKKYNISRMVNNGFSWNNILTEIDKCDVVCANCHLIRTSNRANWYKSRHI